MLRQRPRPPHRSAVPISHTIVEQLEMETEWLLQACKSKTQLPPKTKGGKRNPSKTSPKTVETALCSSSSAPVRIAPVRMVKQRKRPRPQQKVVDSLPHAQTTIEHETADGKREEATKSELNPHQQAVEVIQSRARGYIVRKQRNKRIQVRILLGMLGFLDNIQFLNLHTIITLGSRGVV